MSCIVFLAEYLKNPIFAEQRGASTLLPLIGPLCSGLMYGSGELCDSRHLQRYSCSTRADMVSSHVHVPDREAANGLDRGACLLGEPFRR